MFHIGLVVVRPSGQIELDYFHMLFPHVDTKNPGAGDSPTAWLKTYRPNCQIFISKVELLKEAT